jgi:hypothetical protein
VARRRRSKEEVKCKKKLVIGEAGMGVLAGERPE